MDLYRIREKLRKGGSIYDLPLRVTFYARVSTEVDAQLNSLENQVQYYTEFIKGKQEWTFVPGYIDEGISGTSTKKRDDFNRMIRDAQSGLFDLIITKEISRFSRSTLDSILYTQQLLNCNVGVYFQSDNINTLDADSEFRLVVMAGVAQDEVRKLSERIKFGFRQSIKNGRVLGNDKLYGYNKKGCVMTIKEDEAELVRIIFDLYANKGLGTRRISQRLLDMGYTSRAGNAFNTLTIRHILTNPKYKGWYCGNKSLNLDYRTKKKVFLDESEWVMYPDPTIPAIVPEDLWDRANSLYKQRRSLFMEHALGVTYHNRYAYTGKIYCEAHNTTYHRQIISTKSGDREEWNCKVYRNRGRSACSSPSVRSADLDAVLACIFSNVLIDPALVIDSMIHILASIPSVDDYESRLQRISASITLIQAKKERLLDLYLDEDITADEYHRKSESLTVQLHTMEAQRIAILEEQERQHPPLDLNSIRDFLHQELSFTSGISSDLVSTILERVNVKTGSTKQATHFQFLLKQGYCCDVTVPQPEQQQVVLYPKNNP